MSASIGAMRARIRFERPAPDVSSGVVWEDAGAVWARMHTSAEAARASIRFECRTRGDVRAGWRVALAGRRFRITAVRDGEVARLLIDCEEEMS